MRTHWILLSLLGLVGGPTVASAQVCEQTAKNILTSCQREAAADYFLALANCNNLPTLPERQACNAQAAVDRTEALGDCDDQHDVRIDECQDLGAYHPEIDTDDFVSGIDNPYFPVVPGTTFIYEGTSDRGLEHSEFEVTHNTKVIMGVTCIEVHDVVQLNGVVVEDTLDWFAQDKDGNIWYFGENSNDLEDGRVVSVEGSWTGGVDSAQPGFVMEADPQVDDHYRQEFALGTAEDLAEVLKKNALVMVPYGTFNHCLQIEELTPLDPDGLEHKFYAEGVGNVLTINVVTGDRDELIAITRE